MQKALGLLPEGFLLRALLSGRDAGVFLKLRLVQAEQSDEDGRNRHVLDNRFHSFFGHSFLERDFDRLVIVVKSNEELVADECHIELAGGQSL